MIIVIWVAKIVILQRYLIFNFFIHGLILYNKEISIIILDL